MNTDRELMGFVRTWLQGEEQNSGDRVLATVLDHLDTTPQRRPLWQAWSGRFMSGTMRFAAAGLAVAIVAAVGLALYFSRPAFAPAASPSPVPSLVAPSPSTIASPTPAITPISSPAPAGVVAYTLMQGCTEATSGPCEHRIWTVNKDGTGAREFAPDLPGDQAILQWSPDGSGLVFSVTNADETDGSSPAVYVAFADSSERSTLCAADDIPACPLLSGSLSPDDTRIAYVTTDRRPDAQTSTVATYVNSTGGVTRLESTTATTEVTECDSASTAGLNNSPDWSPAGNQLVFARGFTGHFDPDPAEFGCRQSALFVVNVDDTGLLQLTSDDMVGFAGEWSPDGSTILFSGDERRPSSQLFATDLYTIQPDGSGMRALTTDGRAGSPHWTSDGRIVYIHQLAGGSFDAVRLVARDGGSETVIADDDIAALTALGCTVCPYAPAAMPNGSTNRHGDAYWQPRPGLDGRQPEPGDQP